MFVVYFQNTILEKSGIKKCSVGACLRRGESHTELRRYITEFCTKEGSLLRSENLETFS